MSQSGIMPIIMNGATIGIKNNVCPFHAKRRDLGNGPDTQRD